MKENVKKIYKSDTDYILTGICGGIAEYFEVDPFLIRLVFIILTIIHGAGILIYIALFFIIPSKSKESRGIKINDEKINAFAHEIKEKASEFGRNGSRDSNRILLRNYFALALIILGVAMFFDSVYNINLPSLFIPALIIFIGFFVIIKK